MADQSKSLIVSEGAFRGLPLITYAPRGGGGVNTNAYKCVQGGRGGLNMTKNMHFVRRFFSQTFFNMDILLNIPYKALRF